MPHAPQPMSRRERNKLEKLERITAAAGELFAERGVSDVSTQEIADRADVGTGTLFLYAKTKGELLLLVQNANYERALARGRVEAESVAEPLEALLTLVSRVVECNRVQIDNGRTYLREMVFGDPAEPHHAEALRIVGRTEAAFAETLTRDGGRDEQDAAALARTISAVMFLAMAAPSPSDAPVEEILGSIRTQLEVVLRR